MIRGRAGICLHIGWLKEGPRRLYFMTYGSVVKLYESNQNTSSISKQKICEWETDNAMRSLRGTLLAQMEDAVDAPRAQGLRDVVLLEEPASLSVIVHWDDVKSGAPEVFKRSPGADVPISNWGTWWSDISSSSVVSRLRVCICRSFKGVTLHYGIKLKMPFLRDRAECG